MSLEPRQVLIFTDVDGCLINKHDYDHTDALPLLERIDRLGIPLIPASSKTAAELLHLADELRLNEAPLICENGATTIWRGEQFRPESRTTCGVDRGDVLSILQQFKAKFRFRSFADLGRDGVMQQTDLSHEAAGRAFDRHGTEPLLWDDEPSQLESFQTALEAENLTLTHGGRFWHVSGVATKGDAMHQVTRKYRSLSGQDVQTIAIGDSPIDQSMLDRASWPVGIPGPDGDRRVTVGDAGVFADLPGAAGWAESVGRLLDRILSKT